MGCGERFPQETISRTQPAPSSSSASHPITFTPSSTERGPPLVIQTAREKYSHIIYDSNYNILVIGALAFALSPLIGIGVSFLFMFLSSQESEGFLFIVSLIDPICFGIFIYGIYSISRSEPFTVNAQLRYVPVFLSVYVLTLFLTGLLLEGFEATTMETIDEVRDMALQGITYVFVEIIIAIFLVLGALKFTPWFEEFVTMLGAPYNAPTSRFRWFAFATLGYWGLLLLSLLLLLSAIDNLSISTINNASLVLSISTIVIFASSILQILSGYKIYSVLNNIRQGKFDGTYQDQIKQKYQY